MILLDTHTLIWWITDQKKLSKRAEGIINKEIPNGQIVISSISLWEIALLIKKKKIDFGSSAEELLRSLNKIKEFKTNVIDNEIAIKSVNLEWSHPDPADRIIVATAISLNCPVVTKDSKIRNYKFVKSIW